MKGKHWLLFAVLGLCAVAVIASCKELNPAYCEAHPNDSSCGDAGIGGEECGEAAKCMAPTPVCDETRMACVECTDSTHCPESRPVCSTEQKCVGCQAHTDCADSQLCLDEGVCADPSEVSYTGGPNASDNAMCSFEMPCQTLQQALAASGMRPYVKVNASLSSTGATTFMDEVVAVYGGTGIQLSRSTPGEVLIIKGNKAGSEVKLFDLDIGGNLADPGEDAVEISEKQDVTMTRVKVRGHGQAGIALSGTAKLVLNRSTVFANQQEGVKATGGTLEIRRSWIHDNKGVAGVSTTSAIMVTMESSVIASNTGTNGGASIVGPFRIRNNIFARNGGGSSNVGGLFLSSTDPVFEFNTVANNVGPTATSGVSCATPIVLSNSILTDNAVFGCTPEHSLTATSGTPGGTNEAGDPKFLAIMVEPTDPTYFRIGVMSAARDKADMNATLNVDIDGDPRSDSRKDMGADEYRPAQ